MAYTKQTWENLPSQTTPINADRLTHIEDGIFNAAATADTAASDASSAISGLADKVDKVEGKGLSTNDFTDTLKTKLDGIATGAEVNVQSDWSQSDNTKDDYIKNKPTLGTSAYKNSTSVVTDSTDLVESGAVYTALQGKADNSVIGTVEDGTIASQAYAVGSHFIRNGAFCTVTQAISSGGTLTEGTNYTTGDVASELTNILSNATNPHAKVTLGTNSVVRYGNVVYYRIDFTVTESITRVGLFKTGYARGTNVNSRAPIYNYTTGEPAGFADINNIGEFNNLFTLEPSTYTTFGTYICQ